MQNFENSDCGKNNIKKDPIILTQSLWAFLIIYKAKLIRTERQPQNAFNVLHSTVLAALQKSAVHSSLLHCE